MKCTRSFFKFAAGGENPTPKNPESALLAAIFLMLALPAGAAEVVAVSADGTPGAYLQQGFSFGAGANPANEPLDFDPDALAVEEPRLIDQPKPWFKRPGWWIKSFITLVAVDALAGDDLYGRSYTNELYDELRGKDDKTKKTAAPKSTKENTYAEVSADGAAAGTDQRDGFAEASFTQDNNGNSRAYASAGAFPPEIK